MTTSEPPELPEPEVEYRRPAWVEPPAGVVPGIVFADGRRRPSRSHRRRRCWTPGWSPTCAPIPPGWSSSSPPDRTQTSSSSAATTPTGSTALCTATCGWSSASPTAGGRATIRGPGPAASRPTSPTPRSCTPTAGAGASAAGALATGCWGLPTPGPLAFVCQWPAGQLHTSGVEIDASLVLEAAARAAAVWPTSC
jgi:hypothetical protein